MRTEFATTSLGLAAMLTANHDLQLVRIDTADPDRARFIFSDPKQEGARLEAEFISGDAVVRAADYHRQLRALRRAIHERRDLPRAKTRGYGNKDRELEYDHSDNH